MSKAWSPVTTPSRIAPVSAGARIGRSMRMNVAKGPAPATSEASSWVGSSARNGPIRLALLPIGAYEPRWFMEGQHMNPADAVEAFTLKRAVCQDYAHIFIACARKAGIDHGTDHIQTGMAATFCADDGDGVDPDAFRLLCVFETGHLVQHLDTGASDDRQEGLWATARRLDKAHAFFSHQFEDFTRTLAFHQLGQHGNVHAEGQVADHVAAASNPMMPALAAAAT